MRPIKLTVKGLNSFIEEQSVDFEKLTDRGLFGIFGPTGSGKSTILDGITLALYGDVSRKSSNYINTNCEKANVSFEFQISGAEIKRYIVTREFKRDKKSGNPVSGKCKMVDITNGEDVLADKVKSVTDKCKEVIGLSLEDFTRTVVLPQGKFSEFLKLEGKPRREMLERLFNLGQYGDELSGKLLREISKEKNAGNILAGQLKGYEDISEAKKIEKEESLKISIENLKNINDELKEIEKDFKEKSELWNLQLEISDYKEKESILVERGNEINLIREKIKFAESANKVNPYVIAYEDTLKNIDLTEKELSQLKDKCEELKEKKLSIELKWNNIKKIKDEKLPQYKIQEEKIKDAIEDKKALNILEEEIKKINNNISLLNKKKKENEDKLLDSEERLKKGNALLKEKEEYRDTLNINSELKQDVLQGVVITNDYNSLLKVVSDYNIKIKRLKDVVDSSLKEKKVLDIELNDKENLLKSNEKALEELNKNCPGSQEELFNLQQKHLELTRKLDIFNKSKEDINKNKNLINELEREVEVKKKEFELLENEIKKISSYILEIERENLAYKLRSELKDGDICPVCGSAHHHKENIKHIEFKESIKFEEEKSLKEKCASDLDSIIKSMEAKIKVAKEKIEEEKVVIKHLGEDFNEDLVRTSQVKISELKASLDDYNVKKEELEKIIKLLSDEFNILKLKFTKLEAKISSDEKTLMQLKEEFNDNEAKFKEIENELNLLKEKTKVENFITKNEEINTIEKEKEDIEKVIKSYRNRLEELNNNKDEAIKSLNETSNELGKFNTALEEKAKVREESLVKIRSKVEDVNNIEEILKNIQNEITGKCTELYKRKVNEKEKLYEVLQEENFLNINEVKENVLNKNKIEELKLEVDNYNNDLAKIKGAIESVSQKINNRKLAKEEWTEIQNKKEEKESQVKELEEVKIKLQEEVKLIKEKLLEQMDLLKEKEKLDHKLALLNDLDKLFKGKKFVEFVAATRLKYVSLEASRKLKEVTNGNYGLEVDEDGKFIIRDYKNGGAGRDASTLSGGETFLASLALSLALSAEIQLKGTAPLELFFLDEGFGTLDDNLLEVVMSSLERIHNDKLKVGIISHVESIKNRVPVKLLVTPAQAGMGGSKVKIERS